MFCFPDDNPNPVLSTTNNGIILYTNKAGTTLLDTWNVTVDKQLPFDITEFIKNVISENTPKKMEVKVGDDFFSLSFHYVDDQKCVNIYGFDISDQKELEGKLRESENKYRNIVETSIEGIWIFNSVSDITYVNEKMAEMLGYNREEMIGSFIWDYADEEDKGFFQVKLANRKQGIDEVYECKLIRKDGLPVWFLVSAKASFDDAGKFAGSLGMFTDITDHKAAEEERERLLDQIQQEKDRLSALLNSITDEVWFADSQKKIALVNPPVLNEFGINTEEDIGVEEFFYSLEVYRPDGTLRPVEESPPLRALQGEIIKNHEEIVRTPVHGELRYRQANAAPVRDISGNIVGSVVVVRDITDLKQIEAKLREAYEKLQAQSEELQVANEELRVQADELVEVNASLHDSVTGFRTLADNSPDLIARFDRKNHCVYANPAITEVYGISLVADFYGWSLNEFTEKTKSNLKVNLDFTNSTEKQRNNVFTTGKTEAMEFQYVSLQGKEYWFDTKVVPEFIDGKVVSVLVISHDITDMKEVEAKLNEKVKARTAELEESTKSLRESEARYRSLFDNMSDGFILYEVIMDDSDNLLDLHFLEVNEVFTQMIGLPRNVIIENHIPHLFPTENNDYIKSINKTIITRKHQRLIWYSESVDKWYETNSYIPQKGFVAVLFRDITERKRIEEKVVILANAVESSNDAILTISLDGIIMSWNHGAELLYSYESKDVINKPITILEPDIRKGEIEQLTEKIKQHRETQLYETTRRRKDGTCIHVAVTLSPIFNTLGEFIAISAIVRDITERKQNEATLASIELARKKEIHHRIKNNLQVISSLLDLQAEKFKNKMEVVSLDVINAFRESQDRVASMALIHEELYRDGRIEELHFAPYVENLTAHLLKTYNIKGVIVDLKMDIEGDAFFNMDIAVPLGIIVNELVSNSFKYAFKGREHGEIQIILHRNGITNNSKGDLTNFILTISDNGVGMPRDLNILELDSLGMQLVTSLIDQLDGTFDLDRDNGTAFIMKFSVKETE